MLRAYICALALLAWGCDTPAPQTAADEIQLGQPEPDEPAPVAKRPNAGMQPCLVDDTDGCSTEPKSEELDPSKRYQVPIASDDPKLGPAEAKVTVVVFSDYQCPYCKLIKPVLKELRSDFPNDVRIVWKDLPLPMHEHAQLAAQVGRAAYVAGGDVKFWQANDLIYENQTLLAGPDGEAQLQKLAAELGLAWPPDEAHNQHIRRDWDLSDELNINATPTLFINGRPIAGAQEYEVYEQLVEAELAR